ncbi:sensor histidine kinase [Trichloromonas sp.]|uniref:sensor histidine kinase n=1 Tax=Trichloromonas sp. TaxID=3069249 RepID=UPI003D816EA0
MQTPRLFHSSTFRLALLYMALFSTSVLLLLGFIYWSTAGYMVRQTDATIEAEVVGLAERYDSTGLPGLTALISERMAREPGSPVLYLLADRNFKPLLGNLNRWPKGIEPKTGWLSFRLEDENHPTGKDHPARARLFNLRGGFHLLVGRDVHELEKIQQLIVSTLAWGLAITVVLALLGGTMLSRRFLRRIESINDTCREIIYGDLSRRIPVRSADDDFDQLAGNLNNMLDQIEGLMAGVRQVSDNIAHDLRTPLARLRNRLETLRKQVTEEGPRELLDQAAAEADGLLATFKALLRISQIESGSRRAGFTEIDLTDLLQDVTELYEPLAEEKGQHIELDLAGGEPIRGDRDLLFQAFANLLDNAIKYTPQNGRIQVGRAGVQISVADNGPGIPADARDKVFQRFYRLESCRSTPGNGLGLSLVAAVANLHNARIQLEDNAPGLRVTMNFAEQNG